MARISPSISAIKKTKTTKYVASFASALSAHPLRTVTIALLWFNFRCLVVNPLLCHSDSIFVTSSLIMAKDCAPLDDINSGGSRGGARGPRPALPPLFWVNKEEMTEGRKASWASKLKPGPLLSSKSRFTTDKYSIVTCCGAAFLFLVVMQYIIRCGMVFNVKTINNVSWTAEYKFRCPRTNYEQLQINRDNLRCS